MKMNLVAALIVLFFSASFHRSVELPFELTEVATTKATGPAQVKTATLKIFKENDQLRIGYLDKSWPLGQSHDCLDRLNPALPVVIAVEKESGLEIKALIDLLARLKERKINHVSLLAAAS